MGNIIFNGCKEVKIDTLYKSRFAPEGLKPHKVSLRFENSSYPYDVILSDSNNKPDCKISSFTANLWFRTNFGGIREKRYKSIKTLYRSIEKRAKEIGLILSEMKIEEGEPARF